MDHHPTDPWRRLLPVALSAVAIWRFALLPSVAQIIERPASELAPPTATTATAERTIRSPIADVLATTSASRPTFFFGYVEFDSDPHAPGGVPGFGPWPQPPSRVATTETPE